MLVVGLLFISSTPTENLSIFAPVSPPAESIRALAVLVLATTGAIFLVVEGILVFALIRFRHGPPQSLAAPPQVYGSTPIEIAWTAAPALVVFVLALVITRTLWEVKADPQHPPPHSRPLHVTVVGHQWWWEYRYENYDGGTLGFITANELHIPSSIRTVAHECRPVYLTLLSADVCHSYWVPRLAGKTDLIPGRTNQMWFETEARGLFLGQCAEFCGAQHAKMLLRVSVDAPETFEDWVKQQMQPAADMPAHEEGKRAFLKHSCVNCHRVRGTSAAGNYAPDLTHLMSRETLASGILPNSLDNLRAWIADPQKIKAGCLMPAFNLSARELDLIVDYLASLK